MQIYRINKSLLLLSLCLFAGNAIAQNKDTGTLRVFAGNFNNNIGKAMVQLYRIDDKVPDNPFVRVSSVIQNKSAVIDIHGLPYGDYAALLVHDENSNNKIDHSYGLPAEQLGYTNNWELGLFTGMPSFTKLKFHFAPSQTTQKILITYKD